MTTLTEKVLKEALALSPVEKAELINSLFMSFSHGEDLSYESAWQDEVTNRIDAYRKGTLSADTVDAVFERISKR